MRVLVIHDCKQRLDEITQLIVDQVGHRCYVDQAMDMTVGRDFFRRHHYDLAIVDLTIPAMAGNSPASLENADWLLQQAFSGDDLKTPADVIAISRDGNAVESIRNSIGPHVLTVIPEDPAGLWRERLKDKITYVRSTRRSRQLAANSTFDLDVAILTALDEEARPYEDLLGLSPCAELAGARDFLIPSSDGKMKRGILISAGASGQAPAAALTQSVLTQFRPQLIMMTGFCGGVEGKIKLGDVAIFKSSVPWDYGKWTEEKRIDGIIQPKFLPRGEAISIEVGEIQRVVRQLMLDQKPFGDDVRALARLLTSDEITDPVLHSVSAGSGSSVVTSTNMLGSIVQLNDRVHVVDMESFAYYQTCRHTPVRAPDYVCIKAVADFCNGDKDDRLHPVCSTLSAHLAVDIIKRRYNFAITLGGQR